MEIVSQEKNAPPETAKRARDEEKTVLFLCLLAFVHVFIYAAAFPTFNNNDEAYHFDLTLKYSQGAIPRKFTYMCDEWLRYYALFGTPEYFFTPESLGGTNYPPPLWMRPFNEVKEQLIATENGRRVINTESSQPPLYYALAAVWWRLGGLLGFHDGYLCYWLRFLNLLLLPLLVWMGHVAARLVFPEKKLITLGVPALLAIMPQTVFYSVTNDILSPITFGCVFICVIRWVQSEKPAVASGLLLGCALAATFLTKLCNLPLIGMAGLFIVSDFVRRVREKKIEDSFPGFVCLVLAAGIPIALWMVWSRLNFGDLTGSEPKIKALGWTHKPIAEWLHHPLFTPGGMWIFLHDLLASFWRGEFTWRRQPLASPTLDVFYVFGTLFLIGAGIVSLIRRPSVSGREKRILLFCMGTLAASAAFLGFLSLIYDFGPCIYPSPRHPYFTSGRLMLGAVIPALIFCLYGLDELLGAIHQTRAGWLVIGLMMCLMSAGEAAVDWPVFLSRFNWFHLG